MRFTKMHGIGNDYIYINCFEEEVKNPDKVAVFVSDRHFGIGGDGIVLILPSEVADLRMRMFNADGSEGKMCGNAIRCVGKYAYENKLVNKSDISVETLSGIKYLKMTVENNEVVSVRVDMGEPILKPSEIPMTVEGDTYINQEVLINGQKQYATAVSMGNPHWVFFVDEIDNLDLIKIGPVYENFKYFPSRVNTEFVKIKDGQLYMRVWERGSGETLACGTGACAVLVSAVLNNLSPRENTVNLIGGSLRIKWDEKDNHVYMTGSATKVFDGEIELPKDLI